MRSPGPHPCLAPGLRVVRRGVDQLQVGLYDGRRVLLPLTDTVERALATLLERRPTGDDPGVDEILLGLARHGLLGPSPLRVGATVAVLGGVETPGAPDVGELLSAAGATVVTSPQEADVVVVLSVGELERERLDPLTRRGTSHLVVRLVDGGAVLGPFVVPGVTACLRCIDAHQSVRDPDHVVVTARYARATGRPRPDGVPDLDPTLAHVALAWAVRDVVAHLAGAEPATWSRTLHLGAEPAQRHEQQWLRHPQCGCCWA
jgi:bacteriocin biosynthesis cyclodehydratase domain-containing protein